MNSQSASDRNNSIYDYIFVHWDGGGSTKFQAVIWFSAVVVSS